MRLFADSPRSKSARKRDPFMKKDFTVMVITPPTQKTQVTGQCPECHVKICYYTDGKLKDHTCTACNETVFL